jgi:hypothetical protein
MRLIICAGTKKMTVMFTRDAEMDPDGLLDPESDEKVVYDGEVYISPYQPVLYLEDALLVRWDL